MSLFWQVFYFYFFYILINVGTSVDSERLLPISPSICTCLVQRRTCSMILNIKARSGETNRIAFKDVRLTNECNSMKYELDFPLYLSGKCQIYANSNITQVNSLFYHQIVNSNHMINQAWQSAIDNESTAVTFTTLFSPGFFHGCVFLKCCDCCALSPKTSSKWKKIL